MKLKSCNIPLELRKSEADQSVSELLAIQEPHFPIVLFNKASADDVVKEGFEESMEEAAKTAAKEAEAGRSLLKEAIKKMNGESPVTMAARLGIRVDALKKNWDMWATTTEKINGIWISGSFRIARVSPADLKFVLLRRAHTLDELHLFLEQAFEAAAGNIYKVNVNKAQIALGHGVTTDIHGLAMDFNPTDDMLREAAYRELRETLTEDQITEDMMGETMDRVLRNMNSYLFGEGPETGATIIRLTGARSKDEIAAVRALAQEAQMDGLSDWVGITSMSSDREISALIKKLKDSGFVFHHSGKVSLDAQGYPMVEMQLIRNEAHRKMVTTYEGIEMSDVDLWQEALGNPSRGNTVVEQLLQHVGGCKVFTLFYGIKTYK
ncbi:hypothetical protein [Muriicola sp. Z0-33]|uniref:hypothetical protein n=1 Tax=Muriicola sp. Z0-33 TaxID=2816957 RepID=UPI0022389BAD|nr:hypothetical protein [Muriicola sp. Z0-33]MCW5517468.1 hypothetical protein [Muriicola sp. Z0-33]